MTDSRQQTMNRIVEIIEGNHSLTMDEESKYQIMHVLNQMHGHSHKAGMQEGINVAKQFNQLQKNRTS